MLSTIFYSISLGLLFFLTSIPDAMEYGLIPETNGAFFMVVGVAITAVCVYLGNIFDRSRK